MAGLPNGLPTALDQFLNMDLLNDPQPQIANPDDGTAGMSFAEMFRHYLAPEVAKLPSSYSLPPLPPLPPLPSPSSHPFSLSAPENSAPALDDAYPFSMSLVPGSPVGGFSPSTSNEGTGASPLSFGDMDEDNPMADWAIDPTFLGGAEEQASSPRGEEEEEEALARLPAVVEPAVVEPQVVIKTEPEPIPFDVSAPIVEEDDEEDDDMGSDEDDSEDDAAQGGKRRKSASSSGSSSKKTKTSVAAFATATLHATSSRSTLPPVPEWTDKPDPESYKKLNSKEKRQLRNKISARNFRHRRKEYITTLEEEISSRDTIISQLRDEVGVMRFENKDLHSEVTMLKEKWAEMMEKMTSFMPTASTSTAASTVGLGLDAGKLVASSSASTSASAASDDWPLDSPKAVPAPLPAARKRTGGIAKPNLQKDVAPGAKRGTGSWATAGMGGGYMPVHTTILPEFSLHNKPPVLPPFSTQNFNPSLNNLSPSQLVQLPSLTAHLRTGFTGAGSAADSPVPALNVPRTGTFESFFESNPFWLRPENVEEYRGQLYGKVAHNMAGTLAAQKTASSSSSSGSSPESSSPGSPPNQHLPVPAGFRPAFFSAPSLSGLTGYKEPRDSSFASDLVSFQSPREDQRLRDQQSALVAGLAAQTLFSRMGAAFVEAFAGSTPGSVGMMSGEKVASVLSGRATLRVVPNEEVGGGADGLASQMGKLDIGGTTTSVPAPAGGAHTCSFDDICKRWSGGKKAAPEA